MFSSVWRHFGMSQLGAEEGGKLLESSRWRPGMLLNTVQRTKQLPQQEISWPTGQQCESEKPRQNTERAGCQSWLRPPAACVNSHTGSNNETHLTMLLQGGKVLICRRDVYTAGAHRMASSTLCAKRCAGYSSRILIGLCNTLARQMLL